MSMQSIKRTIIFFVVAISAFTLMACASSRRTNLEESIKTIQLDHEILEEEKSTDRFDLEGIQEEHGMRQPSSFFTDNGSWVDDITYRYGDMYIKLPEEWERASEEDLEELKNLLNMPPDIRFQMSAANPQTMTNILLIVQDLRSRSSEMDASMSEDAFLELMKARLGIHEGEVLDPEIREVSLGGKTCKYLTEKTDSDEVQYIQYYVVRKVGNEMITMIFMDSPDTSIDQFTDMFSSK